MPLGFNIKRKSDKSKKSISPRLSPLRRTPSNSSKKSDDFRNGDIGVAGSELGAGSQRSFMLPDIPSSEQLSETPIRTSSRLSKTINEILHDRDALPYFIQFLEAKSAVHLLRFWLDAQSFHAASLTRIRTQSVRNIRRRNRPNTAADICDNSRRNVDINQQCSDNLTENVETHQQRHDEVTEQIKYQDDTQIHTVISEHIEDIQNSTHEKSQIKLDPINILSCDTTNVQCDTPSPDSPVTKHFRHSGLDCMDISGIDYLLDANTSDSMTASCSDFSETDDNFISNNNETTGALNDAIFKLGSTTGSQKQHNTTGSQSISSNNDEGGGGVDEGGGGVDEGGGRVNEGRGRVNEGETVETEDDFNDKLQKSIARDAVTIYSKYISLDAPFMINLPDDVRNDAISKICQEDGSVDPTCFVKCQECVVTLLCNDYFEQFKQSSHHYKHQIDLLTSGKVYLADFLYNECAIFYFMEYIEQEGASNPLQFVLSADNFQQHLQKLGDGYNAEQAQLDAMVLYDKYFSLQASVPLGFSDTVRYDVESKICREAGPLPDCFSVARNIILRHIEKEYFVDFLKSEVYYKYLTELITSIQLLEEPTATPKQHRRTGSETSSEYSVGNQSTGSNTLLASGQVKHNRKSHRLDDYHMDDTYLNPEMLWKRTNAAPLKLGQVDKMGQFTSYFQPEPDCGKKKVSGKRFFKKNSEKLKEEEDMALKIAQMIISDVTNVTQQNVTQGDTK